MAIRETTFEALSGAAFEKMEPQEIAALSRDELVRLAFRVGAIMEAIATYVEAVKKEEMLQAIRFGNYTMGEEKSDSTPTDFDIQFEAELLNMTADDFDALSKDELEQLALRSQNVLSRCPIKPGCRFCALPDKYVLHVLLEWLTIEDQARFDMALLNRMDRRAHLHLLRDTEHKGVLSVSGKEGGYSFSSGLWEWLESRNVFMRALRFDDKERNIPARFLACTGRQLRGLDMSHCKHVSDAELGKLAARCPRLEEVDLNSCVRLSDVAANSLAQHCPGLHTVDLSLTQASDVGLRSLGEGCRALKKIVLSHSSPSSYISSKLQYRPMSDAALTKIAEVCPNLEEVNLTGGHTTDAGFSSLVKLCPRLHTVNLSGTRVTGEGLGSSALKSKSLKKLVLRDMAITDAGLYKIAKMCPNMKEVDLSSCHSISDAGFSSLVKLCPGIHTVVLSSTLVTGEGLSVGSVGEGYRLKKVALNGLRISDAGLQRIAKMCPNLEEVDLSRCSAITDAAFSSLLRLCPGLHTLDISSTRVTGEGLRLAGLGEGSRALRKLSLNGLDISDAALRTIAEICPNLEEVDLSRCSAITDAGFSSLLLFCPGLHTVDLSGARVTGEGLGPASLGEGSRALRKLSLGGSNVSDAGLYTIVEMCLHLEEVDLNMCIGITDAVNSMLFQRCPRLDMANRVTRVELVRLRESIAAQKKAVSEAKLSELAERARCGAPTASGLGKRRSLLPKKLGKKNGAAIPTTGLGKGSGAPTSSLFWLSWHLKKCYRELRLLGLMPKKLGLDSATPEKFLFEPGEGLVVLKQWRLLGVLAIQVGIVAAAFTAKRVK